MAEKKSTYFTEQWESTKTIFQSWAMLQAKTALILGDLKNLFFILRGITRNEVGY